MIQQLEGIKQINHNLDKPTRGSHEPLSFTWKGRFIELLHMVAYLNFEIPGFQSNRPLVIYRYKTEYSYHNVTSCQIQLHLYSWFLKDFKHPPITADFKLCKGSKTTDIKVLICANFNVT